MKPAALAALLLTSFARAAGVVYDHAALKVRPTAFTIDGQENPDALSYEGPQGFYLLRASELRARGMREAPDNFAVRTAELSEQASSEQSAWRSYEAEAISDPDAISDKPALDAARKPLDEAAAAVARSRSQRIGGEYRASAASPMAEALRSQPVPAY